jgi:hypothetical protein
VRALLRKLLAHFRTIDLGEVPLSNVYWHLRQEYIKRGHEEGD